MNNELQELFQIQKILESKHYYDISRIAREILEFSKKSSTSTLDILKRISNDEPWEYIKGEGEFRGNVFKVTTNTLIPRVESEQIVDIVKEECESSSTPFTNIIDVGTGSGCLIVSLRKELGEKYDYYATDISQKALNVAKQNEQNILGTEDIEFICTNLITNLQLNKDSYNFVVANLPYIPTNQYSELERCVKDFEPQIALDGGELGTKYIFELIQQCKEKRLRGKLLLEIEPSTIDQFEEFSPTIFKDIYGRERFLLIRLY